MTITVEITVTTTVTVSVSSIEHPLGLLQGSTSGVEVDVPVGADVIEADCTLETVDVADTTEEEDETGKIETCLLRSSAARFSGVVVEVASGMTDVTVRNCVLVNVSVSGSSSQSWSFSSSVEVEVGSGAVETGSAEVGMGNDWDSSVWVASVGVSQSFSSSSEVGAVVPSTVASAPASFMRATASASKSQLIAVPGLLTNGRAKHLVPPLHA